MYSQLILYILPYKCVWFSDLNFPVFFCEIREQLLAKTHNIRQKRRFLQRFDLGRSKRLYMYLGNFRNKVVYINIYQYTSSISQYISVCYCFRCLKTQQD